MEIAWEKQIKRGHHAFLIIGEIDETKKKLFRFLEQDWKISLQNNSDLIFEEYTNLHVEDCRQIEKKALIKAQSKEKIFILSFSSITREASNALLKLFEEPKVATTFFVVTRNAEKIPKTLISRFSVIKTGLNLSKKYFEEAKSFIKLNLGQRFEYAKKLAGDISDEKRNRSEAVAIVEAVQEIIYEKYPMGAKIIPFLKVLEKNRSYIGDQSSSIKMIFEQTALVVEEIKTVDQNRK
jgi:hypothetical protein